MQAILANIVIRGSAIWAFLCLAPKGRNVTQSSDSKSGCTGIIYLILSLSYCRAIIYQLEDGYHTLTQYHMTSLPDHGVPQYSKLLMMLHQKAVTEWKENSGPIVVHCNTSDGVEHVGTFIALDLALDQAAKEGIVDLPGIVTRLREQCSRVQILQTVVSRQL